MKTFCFLLSALYSTSCLACSCMNFIQGEVTNEILEAYLSADAVVLATAESVKNTNEAIETTSFIKLKNYKGLSQNFFSTQIVVDGASCGVGFETLSTYLLYLYGPDEQGHYSTSDCTRTSEVTYVDEIELNVLDNVDTELTAYRQQQLNDRQSIPTFFDIGLEDVITDLSMFDIDLSLFKNLTPCYVDDTGNYHDYCLNNYQGNQMATLSFELVGEKYQFYELEISTSDESEPHSHLIVDSFITPKGIKLGLSQANTITLLGKPQKSGVDGRSSFFRYKTSKNTALNKEYGIIGYSALYQFKNDKLDAIVYSYQRLKDIQ